MKEEILNSKKQVLEKFALMQTFKAIWSEDQQSNQFKLMMEGSLKGETMAKGVLTQADKQWIADLITTSIAAAIKPLQADIQSLKTDMQNVKTDVKNLKDDMKNVKENISEINHRLDRIENCPTIKKELKK